MCIIFNTNKYVNHFPTKFLQIYEQLSSYHIVIVQYTLYIYLYIYTFFQSKDVYSNEEKGVIIVYWIVMLIDLLVLSVYGTKLADEVRLQRTSNIYSFNDVCGFLRYH